MTTDNLNRILSELAAVGSRLDGGAVERLADAIEAGSATFLAGAGRSGLLLRCSAMRLMHMGRRVFVVGEVVTPAIRAGDLLLVGSGSGETGSLVVMAKKAKNVGASLALVTANPSSTIAGMADVVVGISAPTPKAAGLGGAAASAQPMGNLFEQAMFLLMDAVVMELMARSGMTSDTMFERHANLE